MPQSGVVPYALTYDKAGNIIREERTNSLPADEEERVDEIRDYEYDTLGRLTATEITSQPDGDAVRTEYTYDFVGNRLSMTEGDNETEYTYNSLDQLTGMTVTEDGGTVSETESEYDKNGNLISQTDTVTGEEKTCIYDPNNMMTGCTVTKDNEVSVDQICGYSGEGQRIYKVEGEDNVRYHYMGGNVIYTESDIYIQPEEGEGDETAAGTESDEEGPIETKITSFNILSPEGSVIASGREIEGSDEYYTYTKDMRGSTVNILDDSGTAAASYTYTDFGETSAGEDTDFDNEICYTGGIYDGDTGEYYLNARYYDPALGRFTTQDSYRGENTNEGSWNLYAYCGNDSINHTDLSGHKRVKYFRKTITRIVNLTDRGLCAVRITGYTTETYREKGKFRTFTLRCYGALFSTKDPVAYERLHGSIGAVLHYTPKERRCKIEKCRHDHINGGDTFSYLHHDSSTDVKYNKKANKKTRKKYKIKLGYQVFGDGCVYSASGYFTWKKGILK